MSHELVVKTDFGAAHFLRQYRGKCERLHGHNWKLDIYFSADRLNADSMIIDFVEAKAVIRQAIEKYDHYHLNEVPPFDQLNPTSENIARVLCEEIQALLPQGVRVTRLTAWESDRCGATWTPDPQP